MSTSSYIVMVANVPIISKVELLGMTAQPTMEAKLEAVALTMKEEAVFCSNMMSELSFGESFGSVPLHIDNTSALHIAGNRTHSPRAKAYRAEALVFREKTGGGQGQHPLRNERGSAGGFLGHQAPSQAPSPRPN